jgi:GMP synthase-like glutamine amidotransferase
MLAGWLAECGCDLDVRRPDRGEELPPLKPYAGLLVLGGEMDADADEAHPWLPLVRRRIVEAARTGVPTLGVCLGHQLAALALGGAVGRNPHGRTVGLRQVDWEPGVIFDPLLSAIAGEDRALHWNQDVVIDLPPGAEVLATTLDGQVQAARLAPTVWGVQFHPEVDPAVVRDWAVRDPATLAEHETTVAEVVGTVEQALPGLVASWRPLAESFARLVRGRAAARDLTGQ